MTKKKCLRCKGTGKEPGYDSCMYCMGSRERGEPAQLGPLSDAIKKFNVERLTR